MEQIRDEWADYFSPNDIDCKNGTCNLNGCYSCHARRFAADPVGENFVLGLRIPASQPLWKPYLYEPFNPNTHLRVRMPVRIL
jgi:hypothetical protein